ncbi:hypothetical protein F5884DRAFT_671266 [Xylogone sp. PMI_703]|nr:hypothetical protein F5884DRAFT_671266 [Xylogone sp. PMI_703]
MATAIAPGTSQDAVSNAYTAALDVQNYLQTRLSTSSATPTAPIRSLPIIDLTPSFSSSLEARQSVAKQIHEACTTIGFFYITGHGIPTDVCDGVFELCNRFFNQLPQESKDAIHMKNSKHFRGYEPAAYSSVNDFTSKETKEAFNWGYEAGLDPTGGDGKYVELDGSADGTKNQWPKEEELPGFYEGIASYYGHVLQLARHLFRLFALSLDLPENYFDPMMTHPGGIARLIKYIPSNHPTPSGETSEDQEIGLGAHTDYECFTLLLQDSTSGLEVLSPDNHWIRASPVPGGIVVNVADFLMRWTNGIYKSTIHQVVNRTDKVRYSVPFFFSINYDEVVETLPSCVSESTPSKYPPISAGRYVLDRLAMTVKEGGKY